MNASFVRKVVYGSLIVLLWFPLSFIGEPPSVDEAGDRKGGKLSRLRDENYLSQAALGEVDPTSESMKLATLGMRNVAVAVLWTMANEYKKTEDFDSMSATINQITMLAPNFVAVWEFQAHNETYNVSVEYDAYKMRYAWVKKGIDLLIRGTEFNGKDTRLVNYLSWFFGQKLGRADEKKQFRELFRDDHDYHAKLTDTLHMAMDDRDVVGPNRKDPDNWLVGRKVQLRAVDLVETQGVPIRGKSPLLFFSDATMMRINYSKAIEEEGWLGDIAGNAWRLAGEDWKKYGEHPIPTSWGHDIHLGELERYRDLSKSATDKLEALAPGLRKEMEEERRAKLRPEEREALDTPAEKRTEQQFALAMEAEGKVQVHVDEVADRLPTEKRRQAKILAQQAKESAEMASRIERYRDIVNYGYWRTRCEVEQSPEALAARQYMNDAHKAYEEGLLDESADGTPGAKELYEKAWQEWAKIYEKYPDMMSDIEADVVVENIQLYRGVLNKLEYRTLPDDFPLRKFLEVQRKGGQVLEEEKKALEASDAVDKPDEKKEPAADKTKTDDKPADDQKDPAPTVDASATSPESAEPSAAKTDEAKKEE